MALGPSEARSWKQEPHQPREATRKLFVFPALWMVVVRGGGEGFPVRNQNPMPVQCEIQIYTILKWYFQAKKFNIKTVKLLGLWQKQMQNHCAGAFPEPRAHSTPAGTGRKPDKLAILGASRRDAQVNRQSRCCQL